MVHRGLPLAIAAVLAVLSTGSTVHAITITEDAPSAGASAPYNYCTATDLAVFAAKIKLELDDCTTKASYDWNSNMLPTAAQRNELCACKALMSKLQTVSVPNCGFVRVNPTNAGIEYYTYKALVKYGFDGCSTSSSTTKEPTTTTTTTPMPTATQTPSAPDAIPTYTPYTYVPVATSSPNAPSFDFDTSHSSSSNKSKSNAGVIAGVITAPAVVAAVVGFVIRKRKRKNGGRKSRSLSVSGDLEAAAMDIGEALAGALSPLGGGGDDQFAPYTTMPSSPLAYVAERSAS